MSAQKLQIKNETRAWTLLFLSRSFHQDSKGQNYGLVSNALTTARLNELQQHKTCKLDMLREATTILVTLTDTMIYDPKMTRK